MPPSALTFAAPSVSVLFVCTGNICRSPTAEAVFRAKLAQIELSDQVLIDSAGVEGWHTGEAPDSRAIAAARRRGYDLSMLCARKILFRDFFVFDRILGLDRGHVAALHRMAPKVARPKIQLFLEEIGVPDPYYGDRADFEHALDLIELGCEMLLAAVIDKTTFFTANRRGDK